MMKMTMKSKSKFANFCWWRHRDVSTWENVYFFRFGCCKISDNFTAVCLCHDAFSCGATNILLLLFIVGSSIVSVRFCWDFSIFFHCSGWPDIFFLFLFSFCRSTTKSNSERQTFRNCRFWQTNGVQPGAHTNDNDIQPHNQTHSLVYTTLSNVRLMPLLVVCAMFHLSATTIFQRGNKTTQKPKSKNKNRKFIVTSLSQMQSKIYSWQKTTKKNKNWRNKNWRFWMSFFCIHWNFRFSADKKNVKTKEFDAEKSIKNKFVSRVHLDAMPLNRNDWEKPSRRNRKCLNNFVAD